MSGFGGGFGGPSRSRSSSTNQNVRPTYGFFSSSEAVGTLLASENPADPFVYFTKEKRRSRSSGIDQVTGAIRLDTMTDCGVIPFDGDEKVAAFVSADGLVIGAADRPNSTVFSYALATGFPQEVPDFQRWPDQRFGSASEVKYLLEPNAAHMVGRHGFASVFGDHPITPFRMSGGPLLIRNQRILWASGRNLKLVTMITPTEKKVEDLLQLRSPDEGSRRPYQQSNTQRGFQYAADLKRNRLIAVNDDKLMLFELDDIGFSDESTMAFELDSAQPFVAGSDQTRTILSHVAGDVIHVEAMPEGMQSRGAKLRWKPGREQLGVHRLQVTVRRGDSEVRRIIPLQVVATRGTAMAIASSSNHKGSVIADVQGPAEPQMPVPAKESFESEPANKIASTDTSMHPGAIGAAAACAGSETVLLSAKGSSTLLLYSMTDFTTGETPAPSADIKLGRPVIDIASKQLNGEDVFLVLSGDLVKSSLLTIDPRTLKVVDDQELPFRELAQMSVSSDPSDAWVFFSYRNPSSPEFQKVLPAFNTRTGESAKLKTTRTFSEVCVSAEGAFIIMQTGDEVIVSPRSPGVSDAIPKLLNDSSRGRKIAHPDGYSGNREGHYWLLPAPYVPLFAARAFAFQGDQEKPVASISQRIVAPAFLRERSVMLGISLDTEYRSDSGRWPVRLQAFDGNSFQPVGQPFLLSNSRQRLTSNDEKHANRHWKIIPDEKRKRVICATDTEFVPVSYDELKLPSSSWAYVKLVCPAEFPTGKPAEIRIVVPDEESAEITSVELAKGMTRDGNVIRWTPTTADIGRHRISVSARFADYERTTARTIEIQRHQQKTDLPNGHYAIDPDSGRLLAIADRGTKLMSFAATQDGFEKSPSQEADVSGAVSDMILRSFGGKSLVILAVPDKQHLEIRTVSDLKHQANVPCATEPVRLEASQNPADPRVYYLPKNSGQSSVSSVCLRTRRDHGLAIPETKKFAISPTGNSIYTTDSKRVSHHPKSATVFPSILVNGFGNDPPQFRLYARQSVDVMDHQPLPDPYGRGLVRVNHNDTPASLVLRDGLTVLNIGFGSDQREMSMSVREGRGMPVSLRARNAKSVSDYPVEVALTRVPWATDRGMPGFRKTRGVDRTRRRKQKPDRLHSRWHYSSG